jgi:hypothetical protein
MPMSAFDPKRTWAYGPIVALSVPGDIPGAGNWGDAHDLELV